MAIDFTRINIQDCFERYDIKFEVAADKIKVECPWHGDKDPSGIIDAKGYFHCFGCGHDTTVIDFIAKVLGKTKNSITADCQKWYDLEPNLKIFEGSKIEEFHNALPAATQFLKQLYARGITDEDIRQYRIGYDAKNSRITIPIRNPNGDVVNLRGYNPFAEGRKFTNAPGCGRMRLFPVDQLKYQRIILCGGELKAIAAARQCNSKNIGAISTTGGEGNWNEDFTAEFKDKRVVICFDIDRSGEKAAEKIAKRLCNVADFVGILKLPLDSKRFPKGDINDFVANGGNLCDILSEIIKYEPNWVKEFDEDPEEFEFAQLIDATHTKKRVKFEATVSSLGNAPYSLPKKVTVKCNQDQKVCAICPVALIPQDEFEIHPEDEALLSIVDTRKSFRKYAIQEATGIPTSCRMCEFEETEFFSMEKVRISQNIDITKDSMQDKDYQIAIHNGALTLNNSYEFTGRLYPHPETQSLTFLLSESQQLHNSLDSFRLEKSDSLNLFQPRRWDVDSIRDKINEIYEDFEANVTRIYKRRAMHLVIDLAYHSPLWATENVKGWAEVLIVGDTGQGKTQCAYEMRQFYRLGEFVSCNNTTFAGLVGGLKQYTGHKGWWIEWGVLPQNDRQLVVLEELKGLPVPAIAQMTDIRSSGMVRIDKIEKRSTYARTRLVCLSNPRDKTLQQYPYGCLCVQDLIGQQQDIRRFDFVYVVSKNVVPNIPDLLANPPTVEHRFTSELCRNLILWAWTSKVKYEDEAERAILEAAEKLNEKYECELEILTPGTTHEKIFRLSAALAARTFSHDDSYNIFVRRCHVDFIVDFLMKHYDSGECDYKTYSKFSRRQGQVDEDEMKKLFQQLGDAKPVIRQLLGTQRLDIQGLACLISSNRELSNDFVRALFVNNAIKRDEREIKLTPSFIHILKKFESNGALDAPSYLKERGEF